MPGFEVKLQNRANSKNKKYIGNFFTLDYMFF